MSPKEAKVFVAEDNEKWRTFIGEALRDANHSVVLEAATLKEALSAAKRLKGLGVQVATIDGNLNPSESSGHDGEAIIAAIRKEAPDVKIIGMSGLSVRGADVDVGKVNLDKLGKTVTDL